jgi:signal transduction histidine kinase
MPIASSALNAISHIVADVNAAQVKQVILNLIANGLQATTSGGRVEIVDCRNSSIPL